MEIIQIKFSEEQYYKSEFEKKQIVLHHTVSGAHAKNVFEYWALNAERVATAFVISANGEITQVFDCKYWAHHLGLHKANNVLLNKNSIGIELCNWGGLKFEKKKYFSAFGYEVKKENVIDYGKEWRGFRYFEKYTSTQIESLRQLLLLLTDKFSISKNYNETMWEINAEALAGKNGIYTHVSYREDKSDMHPQVELIEMLRSLK